MSGYPKATCDPGTEALRMANERADRWKQRHDALAARLASVEEGLCDALMAARQGEYDGLTVEQHLEGQIADLRAVLGSDAHAEQEGTGE